MTYTRHGHHIPGTPSDDEHGQINRARCGGVGICSACSKDANAVLHITSENYKPEDLYEDISQYDQDPDRFMKKIKLFVVGSHNNNIEDMTEQLSVEDLYIVWFTYILGGYKSMVSTTVPGDGLYFEVTFDVAKNRHYVDCYKKISNDVFSQDGGEPDAELAD